MTTIAFLIVDTFRLFKLGIYWIACCLLHWKRGNSYFMCINDAQLQNMNLLCESVLSELHQLKQSQRQVEFSGTFVKAFILTPSL